VLKKRTNLKSEAMRRRSLLIESDVESEKQMIWIDYLQIKMLLIHI
jgi:hypothetical protein